MKHSVPNAPQSTSRSARQRMVLFQRLGVDAVAHYLRRTPFSKGRFRLEKFFLPMLREIGPDLGTRIVRTRRGFDLNLDLAEWIGQHIYLTGDYEPPTADLVDSLIDTGDTVVDVGANIGFFALVASAKVGAKGSVIAFEPVSSICTALTANLELNRTTNVTVHELALANRIGTVTINEGPRRNRGLSSLRTINGASAQRVVRVSTFDSLDVARQKIRLIKIDVEGAEQLVLEGMMATLRKHRPHLIVELTADFLASFGHSPTSLCGLLQPLGYRVRRITDRGLVSLPGSPSAWPSQFNAFFAPDRETRGLP